MESFLLRLGFTFLVTVTGAFCISKDTHRNERSTKYDTGKELKVTSLLEKPYLMVENASLLGNDRYQGFIADLLQEISSDALFPFKYEINVVKDGQLGSFSQNGNWTGMVGEVQRGEADFAAAPLRKTQSREVTVRFTKPFLDIHVTMLIKKPAKLMETPIESLSDLLNQTALSYGWVKESMTEEGFRSSEDPSIRHMYAKLYEKSKPVASFDEGLKKVRDGSFVLITENTEGDYIANQKPCTLVTSGKVMDLEGYGFAVLRTNTDLYNKLDKAVDNVKKAGKIDELYTKWWLNQGCESGKPKESQSTSGTRGPFTLVLLFLHVSAVGLRTLLVH